MLQKVLRRPSPGTVLALVALVMAVTPIANAFEGSKPTAGASQAKKKKKKASVPARARFADNADKVDGYSVSYAGRPGYLVPLGPDGKFPRNVIPTVAGTTTTGSGGATGPQGPKGDPGTGFRIKTINHSPGTNAGDPQVPAVGVARCDADQQAISGGYEDLSRTVHKADYEAVPDSVNEVIQSKPLIEGNQPVGWYVQILNVPPATDPVTPRRRVTFQTWVTCVG
jgi:hypothetical protein